jgi:hypothetical protein
MPDRAFSLLQKETKVILLILNKLSFGTADAITRAEQDERRERT